MRRENMTVNAIETNDHGNTERADLHLIVEAAN
jgi:hypothetical protein